MNHNTPPRDPHVNFDVGHEAVSRPSSRRTPSNQTSPPSSYPQPTMSRTMSRSSANSHRSSTSDHMKSQWQPKQSIAISSVEGKEGKGNVVGSRGLSGEVEKGLSSCQSRLIILPRGDMLMLESTRSVCQEREDICRIQCQSGQGEEDNRRQGSWRRRQRDRVWCGSRPVSEVK